MYKFLFFVIVSLFFVACSSNNQDSTETQETTKYLSISKAPIVDFVPIFNKLTLEFNAELNTSSVTDSSAYIEDENGTKVGLYRGISVDINKTKVIFTPYQYLKPSKTYTIFVTTDVKSIDGLSLSQDYNASFVTANDTLDLSSLDFELFKPSSDTNVSIYTNISIQFSKNISDEALYDGSLFSGNPFIEVKKSDGTVVDGMINFFNSIVTFVPQAPLELNETYNVELLGRVTDMYGNVYNGNKTWSFSTAAASVPVNVGFKPLSTFALAENATYIRAMQTRNADDVLAVATQSGVRFFDLNISSTGYQTITPKYDFSIPSQINTIEECDNQYLMVGTMNDGIYILELNETILNLHSHLITTNNSAVSGVTCAKDVNNTTDTIYAVGPELGMDIFTIEQNDTISFTQNIPVNDGVAFKVSTLSYTDYTQYPEAFVRRVYVADYENGVRIYDENGSLEMLVDLNGSTRSVAPLMGEFEPYGIYATNSIGTVTSIGLDGNITQMTNFDIPSFASDMTMLIDSQTYLFKMYIVDPDKGMMILNLDYNGVSEESIISSTPNNIISASVVKNTSLGLIATLDSQGNISIYNAVSDTLAPTISSVPSNLFGTDVNITIVFSEYVNSLDINETYFTIEKYYTGEDVPFTLLPSANAKTFILKPDTNLTSYTDYNVTIHGNIVDRVGNVFNDGNDYIFTFQQGI